MIAIREHEEGWQVPIWAQPGARKEGILGVQNGSLKVAVTAPADQGRANKALVELLRAVLQVKRSQVELLKGDRSRHKVLLIRGLSREELEKRLGMLSN